MNEQILKVMNCAILHMQGWSSSQILSSSEFISDTDMEEGIKLANFLQNRYESREDAKVTDTLPNPKDDVLTKTARGKPLGQNVPKVDIVITDRCQSGIFRSKTEAKQ